MDKEAIIEMVGIALWVICLSITIPMWLRIKRDMLKDFDEERKKADGNSNEVA